AEPAPQAGENEQPDHRPTSPARLRGDAGGVRGWVGVSSRHYAGPRWMMRGPAPATGSQAGPDCHPKRAPGPNRRGRAKPTVQPLKWRIRWRKMRARRSRAQDASADAHDGLPMLTFQQLILRLQDYWGNQGCALLQPYDMEVGAGTSHTATFLRSLGPEPWRAAYVQPSRRPRDGRYGENPNRLQHYYQYPVVLKPAPPDILELYLGSLRAIGIDPAAHDVRFVEDDWENPTLGAWGLGWEVWLNGMEITQFTYFQQVGGLDCKPITGEITYGLER